jgi:hypothetical protein
VQPGDARLVAVRGDPCAQELDQQHVDEPVQNSGHGQASTGQLTGEQAERVVEGVAAGPGRDVHDLRQQRQQRRGDGGVVVIGGVEDARPAWWSTDQQDAASRERMVHGQMVERLQRTASLARQRVRAPVGSSTTSPGMSLTSPSAEPRSRAVPAVTAWKAAPGTRPSASPHGSPACSVAGHRAANPRREHLGQQVHGATS